jgi:hypothetical protein
MEKMGAASLAELVHITDELHACTRIQWRIASSRAVDYLLLAEDDCDSAERASEAIASRHVTGSASNATPPIAAMTGTESCTVAARAADKWRSAAYHTT